MIRIPKVLWAGICIAVLANVACSGRVSEQARSQGDIYLRLGNFAEAKSAYEEALEANPANATAHAGMARVYKHEDDTGKALEHYRLAIEHDPDGQAAYAEIARLFASLGEDEQALEFADRLTTVDRVNGHILKASLLDELDRGEEAVELLNGIKSQYPRSEPLRVALGFAFAADGQLDKAEAEFRSVIDEIDPTSNPARMGLVEVYRLRDELPAVIEEFRDMTAALEAKLAEQPGDEQLKQQHISAQLQLALSLLEEGRIEEAEQIVNPLLKEMPDSPWVNYVAGSCMLARGDIPKAMDALRTASAGLPQSPIVQEKLASVRAGGQDSADSGTRVASRTPSRSTSGKSATESISDSPGGQGQSQGQDWELLWNSASFAKLLERRETFPESERLKQVLALSALFQFNQELAGELATALPAESPIRRFIELLPAREIQPMLDLMEEWTPETSFETVLKGSCRGFMFAMAGLRGRALETLSRVGMENEGYGAPFYILGKMYDSINMPKFAARAYQRLLNEHPESYQARLLLYRALRRANLIDEARTTAEATHALYPDRAVPAIDLAEIYLEFGETALAQTILDRAIEDNPENLGLRLVKALALLREDAAADAAEMLRAAGPDGTLPAPAREMLAYCAAYQGNWEEASSQLEEVNPAELRRQGRWLACATRIRQGDMAGAVALLQPEESNSAGDLNRDRVTALLAALDSAPEGASGQAVQLGEAIRGNSELIADYAFALGCLGQGLYNQAYNVFTRVIEDAGSNPLLLGQAMACLGKASNVPDPIAKAEALAERFSDEPAVWLALANIHKGRDDAESQRAALDQAMEAGSESGAVWFARAVFAEEQQEPQLALESYRRLVEMGVSNPSIHNNYAYYLLETGGSVDEALDYAQRAHEELSNNPHVLHTLGLAQMRSGDMEQAQRNLAAALEMLPGNPTLHLDFGQLLINMDRADDGRDHVGLAVRYAEQLQLDFSRKQEAEAILAGG